MGKDIQWYVTKYGKIIHKHDYEYDRHFITLKIYLYEDSLYQELWNDGYCIHFNEILD